ncbi:ABC transporter ATP-binding protein [Bacillus coahuilensis]|uniref:ABC transporter ATP-binding protein n=1 Tax=Bacillus coahuilensis TaxID=408580 RepID=UPI000A4AEDAD
MDTFKKLKSFYWPYKKYFIISLVFYFLQSLPLSIQFYRPLMRPCKVITIGFLILALGFVGLMIIKGIFTYVHQYCGDLFGIVSVYKLRNSLYEKLQFLPFRYYDNAKTGDLMSRLTADVEAFRFFLSFGITEFIRFILLITISFGVMMTYSWQLTLVTLSTLPFLAVAVYRFDKAVHPAFRGIRKSFGKLNTNVQENLSGINTVKSLSRENYQIDKFNSSNGNYKENYLFTSNIWAKYFPLMELMGNLSVVLLLGYGGYLVINGSLQPGELVAFYSLVWYFIWPIMNLGFTINLFSQAKASGERLLEILDESEDIEDSPSSIKLPHLDGEVEFQHVTLQYNDESEKALKDVSFVASKGSVIGLIGETGSGKTSLTQLLTRFYEPTSGKILIDGRDIKDYSIQSLRNNVGVVLQESFLFSSTIASNISYGKPDASMEEIVKAAKIAQAHDFIIELPDGYDTILGERGLGLSGGQKQRIAIARAICTDPSILILDDATSAVDMETEFSIQKALQTVMKNRTTFIIAHRISSLKHADEILVLENGEVVERGKHEELLSSGGPYQRIYEIQYKDQKKILQGQESGGRA